MDRKRIIAPALCAAVLAASCISSAPPQTTDAAYELTLSFRKGAASTGNIIYVAWAADSGKGFVRYFYTCERLLDGSSRPNIHAKDTCPYWRLGLYDTPLDDGVDVVSGATKRDQDFTAGITVPAGSPSRFTVYFEYDRSFDGNDWWTDQPAILYAADVDLSEVSASKTFMLDPRGWSINNDDEGGGNGGNGRIYAANPPASAIGALQGEMRYIANHAASAGSAFGAAYDAGSAEDATNMVASIALTATRK